MGCRITAATHIVSALFFHQPKGPSPVRGHRLPRAAICQSPAIDFYLATVVFPKEMKQFPLKLSASGWDLAKSKTQPLTGFSGTNDSKGLLPLSGHGAGSAATHQCCRPQHHSPRGKHSSGAGRRGKITSFCSYRGDAP